MKEINERIIMPVILGLLMFSIVVTGFARMTL